MRWRVWLTLTLWLIGVLFIIAFPKRVFALAPSSITLPSLEISEIYYDAPGADTNHEWFEITNVGPLPITIVTGRSSQSWRVSDGDTHFLTLANGQPELIPGGRAVIADDSHQFLLNYPDYTGILFDTSISLSNSEGTLRLSSDGGTSWFYSQTYTADAGGRGDGYSIEWLNDHFQPSTTLGGTPGRAPDPPPEQPAFSPLTALVLKKIMYNPVGSDTGHEWLEIQNTGSQQLASSASSDWQLAINDRFYTLRFTYGPTTIYPGDSFFFVNDLTSFQAAYPLATGAIFTSTLRLTNTAGRIQLRLNKDAPWLIDEQYTPPKEQGAGSSAARAADGRWWTVPAYTETPAVDYTPPPKPVVPELWISEFLPRPAPGQDEWIEIYNPTETEVSLIDWVLDDDERGSPAYQITADRSINTSIPPHGFRTFFRAETGIILSDTADAVRLFAPSGALVAWIPYQQAPRNVSWIRSTDGATQWSTTFTPSAENIYTHEPAKPSLDSADSHQPIVVPAVSHPELTIIDQAQPSTRSLAELPTESGWHLRVQGTVLKTSGTKILIQDTSGEELTIRWRGPKGQKPPTRAGYLVELTGTLVITPRGPELEIFSVANFLVTRPVSQRRAIKGRVVRHVQPQGTHSIHTTAARRAPPPIRLSTGLQPARPLPPLSTILPSLGILGTLLLLTLFSLNFRKTFHDTPNGPHPTT